MATPEQVTQRPLQEEKRLGVQYTVANYISTHSEGTMLVDI